MILLNTVKPNYYVEHQLQWKSAGQTKCGLLRSHEKDESQLKGPLTERSGD